MIDLYKIHHEANLADFRFIKAIFNKTKKTHCCAFLLLSLFLFIIGIRFQF
jgi:hypothetical protein